MARIHVAGNSVLDVIVQGRAPAGPVVDGWGANVNVLTEPVVAVLGGCGAAPAYVLGRLGHSVTLSTNIGDDAFGSLIQSWLHAAGVVLRPPADPSVASATHLIHVLGSNRQSSYWQGNRVDWKAGFAADAPEWFVATGYGAVVAEDVQQLIPVCARLRVADTRVLFDPSPWFADRVSVAEMLALWTEIDVLTGTQDELSHWLPGIDDALALAQAVVDHGPRLAVVKCGPEGAVWATDEEAGVARAQAVRGSSVGAGDCFNARLIDGLARGEVPGAAVAAAVRMASDLVREGRGVLGVLPPEGGGR